MTPSLLGNAGEYEAEGEGSHRKGQRSCVDAEVGLHLGRNAFECEEGAAEQDDVRRRLELEVKRHLTKTRCKGPEASLAALLALGESSNWDIEEEGGRRTWRRKCWLIEGTAKRERQFFLQTAGAPVARTSMYFLRPPANSSCEHGSGFSEPGAVYLTYPSSLDTMPHSMKSVRDDAAPGQIPPSVRNSNCLFKCKEKDAQAIPRKSTEITQQVQQRAVA